MQLSPSDYAKWKNNEVTKEFEKRLNEIIETQVSILANGKTLMGNTGETAEATARAVGIIYGANSALEAMRPSEKEEKEDD